LRALITVRIETKTLYLELRLREAGTDVALMSGSGSAIFGLFKDKKKRDRAREVLEANEKFRLVSSRKCPYKRPEQRSARFLNPAGGLLSSD
jgi:4-diphosphocytidyl-2C-methyl-D-erythritol kinase